MRMWRRVGVRSLVRVGGCGCAVGWGWVVGSGASGPRPCRARRRGAGSCRPQGLGAPDRAREAARQRGAGGGLVLAQAGGFDDVAEGAYYSTPVLALGAAGVFAGTECEQGFCPDDPIDRKTMAVWTVRVVTGQDPPAVSETRFVDVDAGGFYGPFVERMAELEITLGCGDGTRFCPDDTVTRAPMAVFLSRAFNLADGPDPNFSDVSDGAWYGTDVARLAHSGITKGCGDGTGFCPEQDTTRAQMATFLHRALTRADNSPGDGTVDPAEPDEPSDILEGPQVGSATRPIDGQWTIPTFICAAEGKYTTGDLNSLVDQLNDELDGFFERLSSQRMTLTFTVGSVLTDDIAWDTTTLSDLWSESIFPCGAEAMRQPGTSHILIFADLHGGDIGGYAGSSMAVAPTADKTGGTLSLTTVVHELAHSVLRLRHLKNWPTGEVFINEPGGNRDDPYFVSPFFAEPVLACYQYEQLEWPVPDYAQPCERLEPSLPESMSVGGTFDDGYVITWEPPRFSDDAPITEYTVHIDTDGQYQSDGSQGVVRIINRNPSTNYRRYEKDADALSHTLDLSAMEPGEYLILVSANTKYGDGDFQSERFTLPPMPPPFGPIRIIQVANTGIGLAWDTESHENFEKENPVTDIRYEVQYSANGVTLTQEAWGRNRYFETHAWLGDLHERTEYTIQVRACSSGSRFFRIKKCTGWKTLTASTLSALPPPGPVSVASGDDWYLLTWEPVPGAESYVVELPNGTRDRQYTPDYGTAWDVQPESTHTVKIHSCSSVASPCREDEQTTVTFSTAAEPAIPPPYRVAIQEIDHSWATIMWATLNPWTTLDPTARYRTEYEYTDGDTSSGLLSRRHHLSELQLLRLGIQPNKSYTLKLRYCEISENEISENVDECSSWTSFGFSNPPAESDLKPPSLRTTDVGDVWLAVSWDHIPGARSYFWRYQETGDDYFCCQGRDAERNIRLAYGLKSDTMYTVQVRSCGDPTQPCSQWATATFTTASSLPPLPQSYPVSVGDVTDTQIQLTWNPSQSDDYYALKWYPTNERGEGYVTGGDTLGYDWTISGLVPDTPYTIAIRTCNWRPGVDCTDWVSTQVTTLPRR